MKDTVLITVPVDSGMSEYYRSASDMERRKIKMMVNSFLRDMMTLARRRQEAEAARGEFWEADLQRLKAEIIANLGLQDVPESGKTLQEIMDEIGHQAQQRGMSGKSCNLYSTNNSPDASVRI